MLWRKIEREKERSTHIEKNKETKNVKYRENLNENSKYLTERGIEIGRDRDKEKRREKKRKRDNEKGIKWEGAKMRKRKREKRKREKEVKK